MIESEFWVEFSGTLDSEAFWDGLGITADLEE